MLNVEPTVIISIVAILVSIVSAVVSYKNYQREKLNQKIHAAKWQKEYFSDLSKWSDESILLLSEALHLCDLDPLKYGKEKIFDLRHMLRIRLSAQIDKGRWFFPNYAVDQHGQYKEEAYRGYRHEVLDGLVSAYRAVTDINYADSSSNHNVRDVINRGKRQFTSEIQKVLNPGSRDAEFKKLTQLVANA